MSYKSGDKVLVTVAATVIEEIPLNGGGSIVDLAYEGFDGETNNCTLPVGAPAVSIEEDGPKPIGFEQLSASFDRIGEVIDQWQDGKISPQDALTAIHEQVGDRPERLADAS